MIEKLQPLVYDITDPGYREADEQDLADVGTEVVLSYTAVQAREAVLEQENTALKAQVGWQQTMLDKYDADNTRLTKAYERQTILLEKFDRAVEEILEDGGCIHDNIPCSICEPFIDARKAYKAEKEAQ